LIFILCSLFANTLADERSKAVLSTLQSKFYDRANGLWNTDGWWNSANSLEALVEYSIYSGDTTFISAIDNTYSHTTIPQTENDSYDDAQWWAIAWIRAYQLTKQDKYRDRAAHIWNYILRVAWDNHCGGGVWWSQKRDYKNAITNELFLTLSTLLYQNDPGNNTYLEWAQREWRWFEGSGMINNMHLINDGLDYNTCRNNGQTTWTYNQGVVLGGLAYLAQFTKNDSLLTTASKIADAVYDNLVYTRGGVLREPCETNSDCGPDAPQFKGIFMRYLGVLIKQLNGDEKTKLTTWLNANADSIWNKDRTADNECGLRWIGPTGTVTAKTQTSALDCLNAVMLL